MSQTVLRLPAIEIRQGTTRKFYTFTVDGKLIPRFASVSRIRRDEAGGLAGYQRPEVLSHIAEIRRYLESPDPLLPNAIVIAFDGRVRFEALEYNDPTNSFGFLIIPTGDDEEAAKPGWIVDGQQRTAAIRDAAITDFPVCGTAFITSHSAEPCEQFMLINSAKPLDKSLIYELLPNTEIRLPRLLQKRRFPAFLLHRLNSDQDSPFAGMIRTTTVPSGIVQDTSILKMLENSLSDGVLSWISKGESRETEEMLSILKMFWSATAETFPQAWKKPPKQSRLMHGAGIVSMGLLMDTMASRHATSGALQKSLFLNDLGLLTGACHWTYGMWEFGGGTVRKWNELQNTPSDIDLLSQYLLKQYTSRVWIRESAQN